MGNVLPIFDFSDERLKKQAIDLFDKLMDYSVKMCLTDNELLFYADYDETVIRRVCGGLGYRVICIEKERVPFMPWKKTTLIQLESKKK